MSDDELEHEPEPEPLSCDIDKYKEQLKGYERIAVTFVAEKFSGTDPCLEAVGKAYDDGFFAGMVVATIPVDSQECDKLAEHEKVELLPTFCVYHYGKPVGCVTPTADDAKTGYQEMIGKLIDLSED